MIVRMKTINLSSSITFDKINILQFCCLSKLYTDQFDTLWKNCKYFQYFYPVDDEKAYYFNYLIILSNFSIWLKMHKYMELRYFKSS